MKQNQVILVIGKKGSGKSYLVKHKLLKVCSPYVIIDTLGEYSDGVLVENFEEFCNIIEQGKDDRVIVRFTDDYEIEELFNASFLMKPHTLVVEEINRYCSVHYVSEGLNRIIRFGRHKGINLIGITQRPFDLPKIIMSMVDHLFLFQLIEPRDLDYLFKITGLNKINKLNKLTVGKYIYVKL